MGGGLMQLVAMGAQDVFLQVILKLPSSKLSTEDTLTFPKNVSNKNSMEILV